MRLSSATWTEVEQYLKKQNSLILPMGSTEQHGPTGPIGTDAICVEAVAQEVGRKLGMLVAPTFWYGMASHHMAFPGSATVRPSVYQAMVADVLRGFYQQGFRRFYVVNGHGGNEVSLRAVFQELKHEGHSGATYSLINWWKVPEIAALGHELYGNEEGSHATPTEVSLAFHCEGISERTYAKVPEPPAVAWPMTGEEMRKTFVTGTMRSNPGLARAEHGKRILEVAATGVAREIQSAPVL